MFEYNVKIRKICLEKFWPPPPFVEWPIKKRKVAPKGDRLFHEKKKRVAEVEEKSKKYRRK